MGRDTLSLKEYHNSNLFMYQTKGHPFSKRNTTAEIIEPHTVIAGDFITPLFPINRSSR